MSIEKYIADIIKREGGFVNHQNDSGGATNYGITQATLMEWRGREVTIDEIKNLSVNEAYKIYKEKYYTKLNISNFTDIKLQGIILDTAVNSGKLRAIMILQRILGVEADGIVGAITTQMTNTFPDRGLLRRRYLAERYRFLGNLITSKPSQAVFAAGWMNRVSDLLEELG